MILSNVNSAPFEVFNETVVKFLEDLSTKLLKSPVVRQFPDLSAFAFYIRRANLQKRYEELTQEIATASGEKLSSLLQEAREISDKLKKLK